jgi:hypothetical protein
MLPNYEHLRQIILRSEGDLESLKGKYSKSVRVAILQFITGVKYKKNLATWSELITQLKHYTNAPEELSGKDLNDHVYERIITYNVREHQAVKKELLEPEWANALEEVYSRQQIETLQSKVFEITGPGNVMMLFNELLGVQSN